MMSAKVLAPVLPGLLRDTGKRALGETWPAGNGIGEILDTGICNRAGEERLRLGERSM